MENKLINNLLTFGSVCLFIISSFTPVVISHNRTSEKCEYLENLYYTYRDERDVSYFDIYKEQLLKESCEDDIEQEKEIITNMPSSSSNLLNPSLDSTWPMKCHDTHHTGRSPYGTADNPYVELWRYDFDFGPDADPSIGADGTIYIGGSYEEIPEYLFAIYPNGTLKWRYYAAGLIWNICPSIAENGTIYIGTFDEALIAINPNGTHKWTFDAHGSIISDPTIGENGTIYFGTMGPGNIGRVYAVNPDGTEKWHYNTGYWITADPAIGDDGTIYIGSGDCCFYAFYPNGTLRWRYPTGDEILGSASIAEDGTVYFCSYDNYLYALYPNGTLRWKTEPWWYSSALNPSIGSDGTIYVGWGTRLFAFDPDDGHVKWEFEFDGTVKQSSSAICADGIIYTGIEISDRDGGEIVAVNPDGTERWRERISNKWVDSSPCIGSNGTIYIGSASKDPYKTTLHAFGIQNPDAPDIPTITGETEGEIGTSYEYTFKTYDPNDDDVYFNIDWGDGEFEDWFGPYDSGEEITMSHIWDEEGDYTIRARAKDTYNRWGPWGKLDVSMPVNQQIIKEHPLFGWLLERFPNAFPLIRYLFRL